MPHTFDSEALLLDRWRRGDKSSLTALIETYQQKIFALALYLIGGNRDKAYEIASASFVKTVREAVDSPKGSFLTSLVSSTVYFCRRIKVNISFDESGLTKFRPEKRESLRVIREAIYSLPFEPRALVLLRDQLSLPYETIASATGLSETEARTKTAQARLQLREGIKKRLGREK